ncbi:hypothetical protein HanHA300_Chr13g0501591 [Helianthus annuus]|nr:hypothetical protein HanHA300_Chr13g0501591 [Helianthus annuus]KAJ0499466.1 hypothetical protein HanHA89_Chr13g0534361 [Helianthus annuus]KAJ0672924.1 hypothetical protein HanOQP8_Chr13g0502551 [Helianthus annuus]
MTLYINSQSHRWFIVLNSVRGNMSETKRTTATALVDSLHTHLRASRTMLYLKLGEVKIRGVERMLRMTKVSRRDKLKQMWIEKKKKEKKVVQIIMA